MTAAEARNLSKQADKSPNVQAMLNEVYAKIEKSARQGEREITIASDLTREDGKVYLALCHNLADDGFKVCVQPVPNDEKTHRIYTKISW